MDFWDVSGFWQLTKSAGFNHFLCEKESVFHSGMGLYLYGFMVMFSFIRNSPTVFPPALREYSRCSKSLPASDIVSYFYFIHSEQYWIRVRGLPQLNTGWLKQQKCTFLPFWWLAVWDQVVGRVGFFWGLSLWVLQRGLPSVVCVLISSSYKDTNHWIRGHPKDLLLT